MNHSSGFPFWVEQESGQIVVSGTLDYEKVRFTLKFSLYEFHCKSANGWAEVNSVACMKCPTLSCSLVL